MHELNGVWYTTSELSELSGLAPATIRDRLRRGYSVEQAVKEIATHDSVEQFAESSWWEDWIGMSIGDLYDVYWNWCISNGYKAMQKQGFSRQIMSMYPTLKTVPTKKGNACYRIIRRK